MSFVPPSFGSLGKKVADLFKKKFEYGNTVTTKHKTTAGVTFESTGNIGFADSDTTQSAGYITTGTQKVNYKCDDVEAEGTLKTLGYAEGSLKLTNLAKGVIVTVKGGTDEKPFDKANKGELYGSAEAEYSQNNFALSLLLKAAQSKRAGVTATGVIGIDGLSIGAKVYAECKQNPLLAASQCACTWDVSADVGVEVVRNGITGTFLTEKSSEVLKFAAWSQICKNTQAGAEFKFDTKKSLTVGVEHNIDNVTTVKAKADSTGDLQAVISHKLANPALSISLASNFKVDVANKVQSLKAQKFGVSFTCGDA